MGRPFRKINFPFPVYEETANGVTYRFQVIINRRKGTNHKRIVFDNKEDYETYFKNKDGAVPPLKNWREAEVEDWVLADDGGVTQIIAKGAMSHPKDSRNYKLNDGYVRTTVGTFIVKKRDPEKYLMDTDFSKHEDRYTFSGKGFFTIEDQIKNRKRITTNEKQFAYNVAHGMDVVEAYKKCYKHKPGKNERVIKKNALLLMSQERIKKKVVEEVKDIAGALGIDHKYILENIKDIAELAQSSMDLKTALESYKTLGKVIGTTEPETNRLKGGVVGFIQSFSQGGALEEPEEVKAIEEKKDEQDVPSKP